MQHHHTIQIHNVAVHKLDLQGLSPVNRCSDVVPDVKNPLACPEPHVSEADVVHVLDCSCVVDACNLSGLLLHNDCSQLHLVLPSRGLTVRHNLEAPQAATAM